MDSLGTRAETAAVGKVLEVLIVILYVAILTTVLFGSVVPDYQTAAGTELSERVLAQSTTEIQQIPAMEGGTARIVVSLPETIRGEPYRIHATDQQLRLDHPQASLSMTQSLVTPTGTHAINGTWNSTEPTVLAVSTTDTHQEITLTDEHPGQQGESND